MAYEDIRRDIEELTAKISGIDDELVRIERRLESLDAGNRKALELLHRLLAVPAEHEDPAVAGARELLENLPDRDA
jgi:chromosome segregation ATPase